MTMAFLYAGQGSQHLGMGKDLYDTAPLFAQVYDNAPLDFDLKTLCFDGPEDKLNATEFTQPCMVAFAIGVTDLLTAAGIRPDYLAGLSLGEYSALYAAGVLNSGDALKLVAFRGQAMATAAQGLQVGMAAILGLNRDALEPICVEASSVGLVEIANYNCPGQLVISGEAPGVDAAAALAKAAGARRCLPLKVSGPFHTSLMAPAGDALAARFTNTIFGPMSIPVLFNCLGDEKGPGDAIPDLLVRQVQSSVYMEDTIRALIHKGVDTIVEIGPGKALSGFVRKIDKTIRTIPLETAAEIDAFIQEFGNRK
ncbi:ACP S-malonyltransferase [Eubacterium barkeri]|uniref:Malonyl CoA-acyl carrier protein transacylase n=1 Tax=Eubacterium barkeri TaxID=1528 RepID=A0A1H3ARP7_EUBBA|nr:ACP S-malonyltransferase [Eubacterium barkeri]SDX32357.1 [acyl-carrier-protein] S-malonyltransferase [Eubacterium barkeri]